VKLQDLKPGDLIAGFEHFGCIPDRAIRTVQTDDLGLFVLCRGPEGDDGHVGKEHHYLDGQEDDDGELVGLFIATPEAMKAYKKLLRNKWKDRT